MCAREPDGAALLEGVVMGEFNRAGAFVGAKLDELTGIVSTLRKLQNLEADQAVRRMCPRTVRSLAQSPHNPSARQQRTLRLHSLPVHSRHLARAAREDTTARARARERAT